MPVWPKYLETISEKIYMNWIFLERDHSSTPDCQRHYLGEPYTTIFQLPTKQTLTHFDKLYSEKYKVTTCADSKYITWI